MKIRLLIVTALACSWAGFALAQDEADSPPAELEVLKSWQGVWDAEIEVWPRGLEAPSIQFKGVETIRPYGEYWLASDFDSEYMGTTTRVHSIVGYDLDQKQMVGTIVDHGPYAASMTGAYDPQTKSVHWKIDAKDFQGNPMVQDTVMTQTSDTERTLELRMPGKDGEALVKFMQIRFVKRD